MIEISQYGFTKGKSHLANLTAFHDGITGCMDRRTAVGVVYLDFNTLVSHRILIAKLVAYGLEDQVIRWMGGLSGQLRPITSGMPQVNTVQYLH